MGIWPIGGLRLNMSRQPPHLTHKTHTHETLIPRRARPSLAASFFAAFFVLPRPRPTQSSPTIACTTQIGVVRVPWPSLSRHTHSIVLPCCCRCWLKSERCPMVADECDGAGRPPPGDSGVAGGVGSGESPCCTRTCR